MRKLKSVTIPQPFATMAAYGVIGRVACRFQVPPGPIVIHAGAWTQSNWNQALGYKVLLKGLGVRSRTLMPVDQWIAVADVTRCEWIADLSHYRHYLEQDFLSYDAEQDWRSGDCCLEIDNVSLLYRPIGYSQRRPTEIVLKSVERVIMESVAPNSSLTPWFS